MKAAGRNRCLWRETQFMHELLKRAILPHLSLNAALPGWHRIAKELAEPPRTRVPQCKRMIDILC